MLQNLRFLDKRLIFLKILSFFCRFGLSAEIELRNKINIATTDALLNSKQEIEKKHIIKVVEYRLFDRNSWVSAINDSSITEYNSDVDHNFE